MARIYNFKAIKNAFEWLTELNSNFVRDLEEDPYEAECTCDNLLNILREDRKKSDSLREIIKVIRTYRDNSRECYERRGRLYER